MPKSIRYGAAMRVRENQLAAKPAASAPDVLRLEFCKADVYTMYKTDAGAPLKGTNSLTEGQAKDRAVAQGFMSVGDLKKDDDGIWRGSAMRDRKSVQVAIDYKGNVVPLTAP